MIRYLIPSFCILVSLLLFSRLQLQPKQQEIPYFLNYDQLAADHQSNIEVHVHAARKPNEAQVKQVLQDYDAIWAHLNYLYWKDDLLPGRERFTEQFYKNLASNYRAGGTGEIQRNDLRHDLHIINWSRDGLACHLIDSAAVLEYQFPNGILRYTEAKVAFSLVFQGDNWRVDALRFLEEKDLTAVP